jgi:hypothetical protein
MAYFLKDKKEFIVEFGKFLENKNNLTTLMKENYIVVLKILRAEIDLIEKDYKILKQKILRKARKKEKFYQLKEEYIKTNEPSIEREVKNVVINVKPDTIVNNKIPTAVITPTTPSDIQDYSNEYRDSENVINILKEPEHSNLDQTKKILIELTDLLTHFSTKVYQHQEMAETSIIFII